jgi:hypothetical protein
MTVVWVVCVGIRRRKGARLRAADAAARAEGAARRAAFNNDLPAAGQDGRGALRLEAEPEAVAVRLRAAGRRVQVAVGGACFAEREQRLLDVGVEARLVEAGAVLPREHDHRTCPGRKPPFLAVKRPARPHKNAMQDRFTMENAKGA